MATKNPLNVKNMDELFFNLLEVRIVKLLIEHAIMQGHQIFGVLSDLMDVAVSLQSIFDDKKNDIAMEIDYDLEDLSYSGVENVVTRMTTTKLAHKKQKIRWQNVCASLIRYFFRYCADQW